MRFPWVGMTEGAAAGAALTAPSPPLSVAADDPPAFKIVIIKIPLDLDESSWVTMVKDY